MSGGRVPDVRAVLSAAAAEAERVLGVGPSAALLLRGRRAAPELAVPGPLPGVVAEAMADEAGSALAAQVVRADGPFLVKASALPAEADVLAAGLRAHDLEMLAVLPLAGEVGVVAGLVVPVPSGWVFPRERGPCGLLCLAPAALQVAAGSAVLEAVLRLEDGARGDPFAGAVVVDGEERVILADGAVRDLVEWRRPDPFGRPLSELPSAPLRGMVSARPGGGTSGARVLLLRRSVTGGGNPEGALWTLRLAARVHAAAEVVAAGWGVGGPAREAPGKWLAELADTVEEARALTRTFADHAITGGDMVGVDLAQVATAILEDHADGLSQARVRVFSFIAPAPCPLPADLLAARSVLQALVARARGTLAPTGGTLTVRTWMEEGWACAAVSDDGGASRSREAAQAGAAPSLAIPEDDRLLAEVGAVVESLGGRFQVERRPGVWNRYSLMLPTTGGRGSRPQRTETRVRRSDSGGLSVLVVDDNPALRSVLRRYLERRGHRVTEATDGDDALRVVAREDAFDRLIVDVQMPGKSGPELFASLGNVAPHLRGRTLFMTGDLMESTTERFLSETGRPAISKPFDLAELARQVEGAA